MIIFSSTTVSLMMKKEDEMSRTTFFRIFKKNTEGTPDKTIVFMSAANEEATLEKTIDACDLDGCSCGRKDPPPSVPCTKCHNLTFCTFLCVRISTFFYFNGFLLGRFSRLCLRAMPPWRPKPAEDVHCGRSSRGAYSVLPVWFGGSGQVEWKDQESCSSGSCWRGDLLFGPPPA